MEECLLWGSLERKPVLDERRQRRTNPVLVARLEDALLKPVAVTDCRRIATIATAQLIAVDQLWWVSLVCWQRPALRQLLTSDVAHIGRPLAHSSSASCQQQRTVAVGRFVKSASGQPIRTQNRIAPPLAPIARQDVRRHQDACRPAGQRLTYVVREGCFCAVLLKSIVVSRCTLNRKLR